jgi:hypothetical protein
MKTLFTTLFVILAFVSCSKDDDAVALKTNDFKSILTNNSSKEWIINEVKSNEIITK